MIHNGFWVVLDALDVSVLENIRKSNDRECTLHASRSPLMPGVLEAAAHEGIKEALSTL